MHAACGRPLTRTVHTRQLPYGDSPFIAAGHLVFKSAEEMQKGLQAHDPALAADMVNYTDAKPQFQVSEIIG